VGCFDFFCCAAGGAAFFGDYNRWVIAPEESPVGFFVEGALHGYNVSRGYFQGQAFFE